MYRFIFIIFIINSSILPILVGRISTLFQDLRSIRSEPSSITPHHGCLRGFFKFALPHRKSRQKCQHKFKDQEIRGQGPDPVAPQVKYPTSVMKWVTDGCAENALKRIRRTGSSVSVAACDGCVNLAMSNTLLHLNYDQQS
jgi:hypothetical protein